MAGAIVLSRAQGEPEAAVTVAWIGGGYAVAAAVMFAEDEADLGYRLAARRRRRSPSWAWCA